MLRVEKTVFISYRRTNMPWALNIFHNLTAHGYDVFFDYESLASGDFENNILSNIRARAHFVVVLTPSALERCVSPDDWLRREIETALDEQRNIVPLFLEGFNFGTPAISSQLTGKLEKLKNYNGLNIPADYFNEAMERLRTRHLNVPLKAVIHSIPVTVQKEVAKQQAAANEATEVEKIELMAQEWFEKAHKNWLDKNYDEAIRCATESIRLKPDFAEAYNRRGVAIHDQGNINVAIRDYNEAIRLKPDFATAYNNRGTGYTDKGDFDSAIHDLMQSIELRISEPHLPFNNLGVIHQKKGDLDKAIKYYSESIRLKSDYALAYHNRGFAWEQKGDYYSAIADYEKSIELGDKDPKVPLKIKELKKKIK
jgi:Flp pilus assembly protein TadD